MAEGHRDGGQQGATYRGHHHAQVSALQVPRGDQDGDVIHRFHQGHAGSMNKCKGGFCKLRSRWRERLFFFTWKIYSSLNIDHSHIPQVTLLGYVWTGILTLYTLGTTFSALTHHIERLNRDFPN